MWSLVLAGVGVPAPAVLCDALPVVDELGADLEARGRAAHAEGDHERATEAFELAYGAYRRAGDLVSAARAARTVGWIRGWVFGEWAVHSGWRERASALLVDEPSDQGRGWVILDEAMRGSDLDQQRVLYQQAIELARRARDPDLECDAMASVGMMLVYSGLVDEGMAHLDGALAAICAGEVEELPVVEGCLCGLLHACERTRDIHRAEQWLQSTQRVMRSRNLVAVAATCRAHYAGLLVAAGRWSDAEDELTGALDLMPGGFGVQTSARCRMAELRVLQGRLEDAAALLEGCAHHEDAAAPLARLHLATRNVPMALEVLDRAVATGSQEDHVLAPLLALRVEGLVLDGELEAAAACEQELTARTSDPTTPYLRALAAAARARVRAASASGDARAAWHQAMALFSGAHMPREAAVVQLELAGLAASDRPSVAVAEARAALAVFERVGDRPHADEAAALLRSLGATAGPGPKRRAELTRREEEVLGLLGHGLTNAEIADRLFITVKTTEHHVSRVLSKLGLRSRTEAAAFVARTRAVGPTTS